MKLRQKQAWIRLAFGALLFTPSVHTRCLGQAGATRDDIKVLIYYLPREGFDADGIAVEDYFQSAMFPGRDPSTTQGVKALKLNGQLTGKAIQDQIRDLNVAPGKTAVVAYFSTHGAIVENKQVVQLSARETLKVENLRSWIVEKKPRFGLIICDVCSTVIPESGPPIGALGIKDITTFEQLFIKPKGKIYTLMATSPREVAFADADGGCFTKALLSALKKYDPQQEARSDLTWEKFFPKVSEGAQLEFQRLKDRYKDFDINIVFDPDLRRPIEFIRNATTQKPRIESMDLPEFLSTAGKPTR